MKIRHSWLSAPLLGSSLFVAPIFIAPSDGAEDDEVSAVVELGLGYQSEDSYRYGRYSGLVEKGLVPWLNLDVYSSPATGEDDWSLQIRDLGLDRSYLRTEWTRPGEQSIEPEQSLELEYREIPHYFFEDGLSPFRQYGDDTWLLPTGWQVVGNTTDTMLNVGDYLAPVEIHHQRERLDLAYQRQLPANWAFEADYRHEEKEGSRVVGAMIGSNGGNARSALLPAALDHQTDIMELGLRYGSSRSTLGISYSASFFRNAEQVVNWQNPFAAHPQWASGVGWPEGDGRLALEPDNSAHRVSLAGSFAFTPFTRAHLEIGYGQLLQDEEFLPYTINSSLAVPFSSPLISGASRNSLDGKIETTNADLSVSTRPMRKMQLRLRYRLDDRDNQTPRLEFFPVRGDSVDQLVTEPIFNRPYSYRTQVASADANYRASQRVRIDAGYELKLVDRNYSEVNESREYTAHLGTRLSTFDTVALQFAYYYSERRTEDYVGNRPLRLTRRQGAVGPEEFVNHPLLRKYYLAGRQRDRLQLRADWFASERLSVGLNAAYNHDDYSDEFFGLNENTQQSYTLDVSYRPGEDLLLAAYLSMDRFFQDQSGRSFTPMPGQSDDPQRDWWVDAADRFVTISFTAEYENLQQHMGWLRRLGLTGEMNAGFEFSNSRSTGDIDTTTAPGLGAAYPLDELETHLRHYRLYVDYGLSAGLKLGLSMEHERYDSDDFALDGVDPTTMSRVLSLGEESPDYSLNWIAVSLGYRF